MLECARSCLVRVAMVPRRNDLLVVNQSKKDGAFPKNDILSQLKEVSKEGRHLIWKGIDFWM